MQQWMNSFWLKVGYKLAEPGRYYVEISLHAASQCKLQKVLSWIVWVNAAVIYRNVFENSCPPSIKLMML